jgi:outer membrane protein assembly factor BamB
MGNEQTTQLVTDGTRAFVGGAGYAVNAYRLSDGAHLWSVPFENDSQGGIVAPTGMAASNGVLYTGSHQSITARSGATGRQLWVVPGGFEAPVVAGGRVFAPTPTGVAAAAAGGCGAPVCPLLWRRVLGQLNYPAQLGGADGSTLFAAYLVPGGSEGIGHLTRLSAVTGAVQWSATAGNTFDRPARAGNVIFVRNWYRNAQNLAGYRLLAYSATATGPGYLRAIPNAGAGDGGGVAVAGGSVLVKVWSGPLIGYRVPGT